MVFVILVLLVFWVLGFGLFLQGRQMLVVVVLQVLLPSIFVVEDQKKKKRYFWDFLCSCRRFVLVRSEVWRFRVFGFFF